MSPWIMGKVPKPYKPSLLANLHHAPLRLEAALAGLSDAELDGVPIPGKWSVRQCVTHIVQADLGWTDIFLDAVLPHHPELGKTRQPDWRIPLEKRLLTTIPQAVAVLHENHQQVIAVLEQLDEARFDYEYPPVQWLVDAKIPFVIKESINWGLSVHVDHHLIHLHDKRLALGKPLAWMADIRTD